MGNKLFAETVHLPDMVKPDYLLPDKILQVIPETMTESRVALRVQEGIVTPIEAALHQRFGTKHILPGTTGVHDFYDDSWEEYLSGIHHRALGVNRLGYIIDGLFQIMLHPDREAQFNVPKVLRLIHKNNPISLTSAQAGSFGRGFGSYAVKYSADYKKISQLTARGMLEDASLARTQLYS